MSDFPPDTAERFWSKVDKSAGADGCWIWTAARFPSGYGAFGPSHGQALRAHRLAYELVVGPIPPHALVLHDCDNRRCVNPAHLRTGTHNENMRDMTSRRRQARQRGETCGTSKLKEGDVRLVRHFFAEGVAVRLIGERFGLSSSGVEKIIKRKSWGHVE